MGFAALEEGYPWDQLAPYAQRAGNHSGGMADLSIGTPVDPTPVVIQEALQDAADAHGYPAAQGSPELREAIVEWFTRRRGVNQLSTDAVLPTVGSKEFVAHLPSLLGLGPEDVVVVPEVAYPTYSVGARLAGAQVRAADDIASWAEDPAVRLVWVNSPANPTGAVLPAEHLQEVVAAARRIGAVVASDECYAELTWHEPWTSTGVPCLLSDQVSAGDHTGLLSLYSLSKQSNVAGYRAAFAAGDQRLVAKLRLLRRHLGMIVPGPVQAATIAGLGDETHVRAQREIYHNRRQQLLSALTRAGYAVDHSEAGLYLWTRSSDGEQDCWQMVADFADLGILVGPGSFYEAEASNHVRIALTAPQQSIAHAVERLAGSPPGC